MTNPNRLGLCAATEAIRSGRLTSEDYTRVCVEAIRGSDDRIQAWQWFDPEVAMDRARAADAARAEGLPIGPLHGIAIGVKDIMATRGIPTTMGSPVFADNVPSENAAVVDKLEAAGGFAMGKTVTTEFAFRTPGKTRNPWHPSHTPGGSSSGSASAVAAGHIPAALGSQTLGSIIRPAAFCGVVGYKPSYGLISRAGVFPFASTLDHIGVFARSVDDAALLTSCLVGYDARDAASISALRPSDFRPQTLNAPPRLALVQSPVWDLADAPQQRALHESAAKLERAGASVREVSLPALFAEAQQAIQTIMRCEAAQVFRPIKAKHSDKVSAAIDEVIETGTKFSASDYLSALSTRLEMQVRLNELLSGCDAVITPAAPGEAPEGLDFTGNPAFCTTWTLCGVPAITIPVALGPRGLPLGLQIVGAHLNDARTLQVAQWCEHHLPFEYQALS